MNQEMLELLIGKYLDSEITPAEIRLLDHELTSNPHARQLLDELRQLGDQAHYVLTGELGLPEQSPEEIISQAWQNTPQALRRKKSLPLWLHNITSLAAGFVFGLTCYGIIGHWITSAPAPDPTTPASPKATPSSVPVADTQANRIPLPSFGSLPPNGCLRHWTHYTDPSGQQWLIETPPDDNLGKANYHGDL